MKEQFMIRGVEIEFPSIFKPNKFGYYEAHFKCQDPDIVNKLSKEHGIKPHLKTSFYKARSGFAPLITLKNKRYDEFEQALRIAEMRNLHERGMFRNVKVDLEVDVYEYTPFQQYSSKKALGLLAIKFDEDEMIEAIYK